MLNKSVCERCIKEYSVARALIDPDEENTWKTQDDLFWNDALILCPGLMTNYDDPRTFKEAYIICPRKNEHDRSIHEKD